MIKNIIVLFVILFAVTPKHLHGQSNLHPNEVGIGYQIGTLKVSDFTVTTHTIYASTGKFDAHVTFSKIPGETSEDRVITGGLSYTIIRDSSTVYPAIHVAYSKETDKSALGIGISLSAEAFRANPFHIIPEAGVSYVYSGTMKEYRVGYSKDSALNISAEASVYAAVNFLIKGSSGPFLVITPGIQKSTKFTIYTVSAGLSFLPLKDADKNNQ